MTINLLGKYLKLIEEVYHLDSGEARYKIHILFASEHWYTELQLLGEIFGACFYLAQKLVIVQ